MSTRAGRKAATPTRSTSFRWAGYLLGFSMGGFFDGILLHQLLQWHHLLSALPLDTPAQIFADGVLHAVMYVVLTAGLLMLWRRREEFAQPGADRRLLGTFLIGFGAWHVIDAVLVHWILGLHRIRMDTENLLFWDLLWFFAFGIVFIAAGWWLVRRTNDGGRSSRPPS